MTANSYWHCQQELALPTGTGIANRWLMFCRHMTVSLRFWKNLDPSSILDELDFSSIADELDFPSILIRADAQEVHEWPYDSTSMNGSYWPPEIKRSTQSTTLSYSGFQATNIRQGGQHFQGSRHNKRCDPQWLSRHESRTRNAPLWNYNEGQLFDYSASQP